MLCYTVRLLLAVPENEVYFTSTVTITIVVHFIVFCQLKIF